MDLTQVNGVKIIARQRARYTAKSAPSPLAVGREIKTVDELLLENDTVIFQCVHPNASDCEYVSDNAHSVTAHQRTHSDAKLRRQAQAELAQLQSRQAKIFENRSNGAKKAAETKRAKRAHAPAEIGGGTGSVVGNAELAKHAQSVITAYNAMMNAHDEFQKVLIGYLRSAQTATGAAVVDPLIAEKAKKWDEMQALLGK